MGERDNYTEYDGAKDAAEEISENAGSSEMTHSDKEQKKKSGWGKKQNKRFDDRCKMRDDRIESGPNDAVPDEPKKESYEVIGVKFRPTGKLYYFDPQDIESEMNGHVIVETARGQEYGTVAMTRRSISGKDIVLPLRCVIRNATRDDDLRHEANMEKETEAFNFCLGRIEEHRLDMKLVDVAYTFDNSKLMFYFTSEGRVDFRDLVKDLASEFRTRIELRQIGIRDEAKMRGGLGVCGRPFCCASFLPDFVQVSIKMAKEQNLSLNSAKISGSCGRLMCCLRYEYDTYLEETAKTPKVDSIVSTPDGDGVVIETSPLAGYVKVQLSRDNSAIRLYHRDDLTFKGMAKNRRQSVQDKTADSADTED